MKCNGIRLEGATEWLNVSKYPQLEVLPEPSQRVEVQVERTERGVWIEALQVLDDGQVHQLLAPRRQAAGPRARSEAELRDTRRLACMHAAVTFAASRPDMKLTDVITAAEKLLGWVEQSG